MKSESSFFVVKLDKISLLCYNMQPKKGDIMKEREINKEIRSRITSIAFILMFLIISTLYAYYPNKQNLTSAFTFLQNREAFYLKELSDGIKMAEAFPISDEVGLASDSYQFKIINDTDNDIHYQLVFKNQLDKITARNLLPLDAKYLRYSIQHNGSELKVDTLTDSEIIYDAVIEADSELTFDFRIWLGENFDNDAMGKTFIGQMEVIEV